MKFFISTALVVLSVTTQLSHADKPQALKSQVLKPQVLKPQELWQQQGFLQPESVLANETTKELYVSNMNGQPLEANGKGYISRVSPKGAILEKEWITGLNAPKGMAHKGNWLYVADLQTLHIIDIEKGQLHQSIKVNGSKMLNDIATDTQGNVYVSDMLAGGIYRLKNQKIEQWISAKTIPHPNGLYFDQATSTLILGTWGEGLQDDFSTTVLGGLFSINISSAEITPLKGAQNIGNLDGITKIAGVIYFNDWINGNVYRYQNETTSLVFNAGKNAADISSWNNQLLVPMMFSERLDAYIIN
ncbi:MAG: SMP-30/gluconolactonase/LRE family protein [Cellvibrionaceae bacterium]